MISVSKATLIFGINPLLTIVFAFFLLSERVEYVYIISIIGALIGISFLAISDDQSEDESKNTIFGILLVFLAAAFQALICVTVRLIATQNIHHFVRPFYVGMTILLF